MTPKINVDYLSDYSKEYASLVSDRFFIGRQFITGQEIIQLTSSIQVNFFIIKRLFELWQQELSKLKSSPFFDYRDIAVHEALTQFMNVLSKRIKVERVHFEPMIEVAVMQAITLATDPIKFYQSEINKAPQGKINEFLRENRKYYKWHDRLITFLIDKAGFGNDPEVYNRAIYANYHAIFESLESEKLLLSTLEEVRAFEMDLFLLPTSKSEEHGDLNQKTEYADLNSPDEIKASIVENPQSSPVSKQSSLFSDSEDAEHQISEKPGFRKTGLLDPSQLRAQFAAQSYIGMKGIVGELWEDLALNQRFMFTKELFAGNSDLLRHALKTIEETSSFESAVEMINSRFVKELNWEIDSEPVMEFILLVFRKFCV